MLVTSSRYRYALQWNLISGKFIPRSNLESSANQASPSPLHSDPKNFPRTPPCYQSLSRRKATIPSSHTSPAPSPQPLTFSQDASAGNLTPSSPQRERGRLKTTHLLRLAILFPEETRALERKYQVSHARTERTLSPLYVGKEISQDAWQVATHPASSAGGEVRGALLQEGAGLVPKKPPWDSDVWGTVAAAGNIDELLSSV